MLDLSIIIVNYNTAELTEKCIESIFKYTRSISFEVIVIDNASTDRSVGSLSKRFKDQIVFIRNKDNVGFGMANNQGMELAQGRYICLLNSDTLLIGNIFEKAISWFDNQALIEVGSAVGMIGCKLLNSDRSEQESFGSFPKIWKILLSTITTRFFTFPHPEKVKKVDYVKGAFMLLKKEVFERVGGFDPDIFMYVEEVEWCYRVKKAGYAVVFWPFGSIIHYGGASSPNGKRSIFAAIVKGYRYFYKKHKSVFSLIALENIFRIKAYFAIMIGYLFRKPGLVVIYKEVLKAVNSDIKV